jgi:hypothetical protein
MSLTARSKAPPPPRSLRRQPAVVSFRAGGILGLEHELPIFADEGLFSVRASVSRRRPASMNSAQVLTAGRGRPSAGQSGGTQCPWRVRQALFVGSSPSYPLAEPLDENRFGLLAQYFQEAILTLARAYRLTVARDATMSAGMLAAERSFPRLKGYKDMPAVVAGLARHAEEVTGQPVCRGSAQSVTEPQQRPGHPPRA